MGRRKSRHTKVKKTTTLFGGKKRGRPRTRRVRRRRR